MKSRIIAIANHKGGVAKTTTTANLGAAISRQGKKVLVVDLDAQHNLTSSLTSATKFERGTIYEAMTGKTDNILPVYALSDNFFLCPSSIDMSKIDQELHSDVEADFKLADLLEPISKDYDFIFLDCPPSLAEVTVNALVASSEVFIPLTAETLPTRGLVELTDIIGKVQKRLNRRLVLSGILLTVYENRKINKVIEEGIRAKYGNIVFKNRIRKNISLAEAPLEYSDIFTYAPESNGARDYEAVAKEVLSMKF